MMIFLDRVIDHILAFNIEQSSVKWHRANQEQQMEADQEAKHQMEANQEAEQREEEEKVSKQEKTRVKYKCPQ